MNKISKEKKFDEIAQDIISILIKIEKDITIPKNARIRIKVAANVLQDKNKGIGLRVDRSLEELGYVADDPNIPDYTRMQIWRIVSQLETTS